MPWFWLSLHSPPAHIYFLHNPPTISTPYWPILQIILCPEWQVHCKPSLDSYNFHCLTPDLHYAIDIAQSCPLILWALQWIRSNFHSYTVFAHSICKSDSIEEEEERDFLKGSLELAHNGIDSRLDFLFIHSAWIFWPLSLPSACECCPIS